MKGLKHKSLNVGSGEKNVEDKEALKLKAWKDYSMPQTHH